MAFDDPLPKFMSDLHGHFHEPVIWGALAYSCVSNELVTSLSYPGKPPQTHRFQVDLATWRGETFADLKRQRNDVKALMAYSGVSPLRKEHEHAHLLAVGQRDCEEDLELDSRVIAYLPDHALEATAYPIICSLHLRPESTVLYFGRTCDDGALLSFLKGRWPFHEGRELT